MLMSPCRWRVAAAVVLSSAVALLPSELRADEPETVDETLAVEVVEATGQPEVKIQGKVIVIGPDGERREFNFDREFQQPAFHVRPLQMKRVGPDGEVLGDRSGVYMARPAELPAPDQLIIGLDCDPANETLRAQLGLGELGLVVRHVVAGAPAADAGLRPHDVLIRVGDQELKSLDRLLELVRNSEGDPLVITYLRRGEEHSTEVTPVPRIDVLPKEMDRAVRFQAWIADRQPGESSPDVLGPGFRVDAVRPGVVVRNRGGDQSRIDELSAQVRELAEQVSSLRNAIEELKETDE